jgi:crossover junction endodeoxyribonuclease RusA
VIELPWPPRALSPNGRAHWGDKRRLVKVARTYASVAARKAKWGIAAGDVPVMLKWTFHPKTKHAVDIDNAAASCKSYADGIADALRVDDKIFRHEYVMAEPVKGGKVVVVLI